MSSRTIIIISLFIAVAMIASVFTYLYRNQIDLLVGQYVAKITTCGNILNEDDCYQKDFCEGIYGQTCPTCQDSEFKRCEKISKTGLAQIEYEKSLCAGSGGEWYRNKLGNFCLCSSAQKFDKTAGCVSQ